MVVASVSRHNSRPVVLGHADREILRPYREVVDELNQDAAERMNALLSERRLPDPGGPPGTTFVTLAG
jgi:hypothetical protein